MIQSVCNNVAEFESDIDVLVPNFAEAIRESGPYIQITENFVASAIGIADTHLKNIEEEIRHILNAIIEYRISRK